MKQNNSIREAASNNGDTHPITITLNAVKITTRTSIVGVAIPILTWSLRLNDLNANQLRSKSRQTIASTTMIPTIAIITKIEEVAPLQIFVADELKHGKDYVVATLTVFLRILYSTFPYHSAALVLET